MRYNDFETMSIYTVENFTSDITVEGYIAEFRDEPHFLELCKQCTNYGKSWGCPPFDFDTESFLRQYKYAHLMATKIIPEDKDIPIEYTQNSFYRNGYESRANYWIWNGNMEGVHLPI